MNDLYKDLVQHTHAVVDRKGEAHFPCPECGHKSSPRYPHCSFNARGWHCFTCGAGGGLADLAKKTGLGNRHYDAPIRLQEAHRAPATWLGIAEHLCSQYEAHRDAQRLWWDYKPIPVGVFHAKRLGVGVLPSSKCRHERLIVPILDGTMIVGLRGRAIDCQCGKWLAPGGTRIDLYPLYNQDSLQPGGIVWIVENPIDALLIRPYTGVATYSVAYWQERWEAALLDVRPQLVVVAYDNDLVGNGGAANRNQFIADWLSGHDRVPQASGIKLVNWLRKIGINAVLYDWGNAEYKADIGSLLMQETAYVQKDCEQG